MKRFFFDLAGELPARDMQGHECASRREARKHATFIAHRIGTERPGFAKGGNAIEVRAMRMASASSLRQSRIDGQARGGDFVIVRLQCDVNSS
jgi:hypothetical protein